MSIKKTKTAEKKVKCEGDRESRHPVSYLIIKDKEVTCGYCGKVFVYDEKRLKEESQLTI